MVKINTGFAEISTLKWMQHNRERITSHCAWHDRVSKEESEEMLKDKVPFTYLLRSEGGEHSYSIAFLKEDGSIKHQPFTLETDPRGWYYLNGTAENLPSEIISQDLNELISLMMHCDSKACNPLLVV